MSQMPETAKKSEHILNEVRRMLEENGVLESRSPMAVLQSQFDAAIAQRDELLEKVAHCESQMVHMRQVIMSKNTVDDKEDCKAEEKESAKPGTLEFLLEVSTALAQDTLRSNAALSSILGIKKTRPSSHQSAIDDTCLTNSQSDPSNRRNVGGIMEIEEMSLYPSYHFLLIERLRIYFKRHDKLARDAEEYRKSPGQYVGFGHVIKRSVKTLICFEYRNFLEAIGEDMWLNRGGIEAGQIVANHLVEYGVLVKNSECGVMHHINVKGRNKREKPMMHVYAMDYERLFS